jgi:hypothetical protein
MQVGPEVQLLTQKITVVQVVEKADEATVPEMREMQTLVLLVEQEVLGVMEETVEKEEIILLQEEMA